MKITLVQPELVVEVAVDVTQDGAGRWRHLAHLHRIRSDVSPSDVTRFGH